MEERTDISKAGALNVLVGQRYTYLTRHEKRAGTEWVSVSARLNGL
jgi:hypothetical protein